MYFMPFYCWRMAFHHTNKPHLFTYSYVDGHFDCFQNFGLLWIVRLQRLLHGFHVDTLRFFGSSTEEWNGRPLCRAFLRNTRLLCIVSLPFYMPCTAGQLCFLHTLTQHLLPAIFLIQRSRGQKVVSHCGFQFESHKWIILLMLILNAY